MLVFWLVWWAWTQFTWALNSADTTHQGVELGTLAATAVSFFMAVALPDAFGEGAMWFAIAYVIVRVIGLGIYSRVAWVADPTKHAAVRMFSLMSVGGAAAVLAGAFAGGPVQYWLWGLAIVLDVIAALVAGGLEGWDLNPDHFSERHGLFVIIALGESLIVAGSGLSGLEMEPDVVAVGALGIATACALWWSYFATGKPLLDRVIAGATGSARSALARDVFSLLHFVMILGVIGFAVAMEQMATHPANPLGLGGRLALGLGVGLFVGGMALALWRGTGRLPLARLAVALVTGSVLVAVSGVPPTVSLAIAFFGVALLAAFEQRLCSTITPFES
jgi:low temperature requirement protein LtrA